MFTISFDHNSGVVGINYRSVNIEPMPDKCESISMQDLDQYEFSTVVNTKPLEVAPQPDTAGFIQVISLDAFR
jgi:hypothetical protein